MMHSKHKGGLGELQACAWLLKQGYEVFRNISQCGVSDLVAWKPGSTPIQIEVRRLAYHVSAEARVVRLCAPKRLAILMFGSCLPLRRPAIAALSQRYWLGRWDTRLGRLPHRPGWCAPLRDAGGSIRAGGSALCIMTAGAESWLMGRHSRRNRRLGMSTVISRIWPNMMAETTAF